MPSRVEGQQPLTRAHAPEEAGVPSAAILRLLDRMAESGLNTHSLLIAHRGVLAFEAYWAPFTAQTPHRLYSASKSFVSVAVGTLVDDGRLGLQDRIVDHFPDKAGPDVPSDVAAMRVVDLLTMRTAHGFSTYKQTADPDWVRTFFTVAPTRAPGMVFCYDTSASVVLAALVERISGMSLSEYLMDRVLSRIGVEGPVTALMSPTGLSVEEIAGRPTAREVDVNPAGTSHGGSGLFCTPRDFLRFAQLCLDRGRWGQDQVVSAQYLAAATGYQTSTRHIRPVSADGQCGYGYQFWRNRHNGFSARGMGGQIALCLPEADLAIVTTGDNQAVAGADQAFFDAVWDELLPALDDPGGTDPKAAHQLVESARSLALAPVPVVPGVRAESSLSARYALDAGRVGFTHLAIEMGPECGELRLRTVDGDDRIFRFGIGELVRHDLAGYGYEALSSAAWVDERTLQVHTHVLGRYLAQLDLTVALAGDRVSLVMHRAAEMFAEEYEGTVSGRRLR